jgi:leucyl-tRNA---protein transferase
MQDPTLENFLYAQCEILTPSQIDHVWADGWRNFGSYFFRNKLDFLEEKNSWTAIVPLRINLEKFSFSSQHQKVLKKQKNTKVIFQNIEIDEERTAMFSKHTQRFKANQPEYLNKFLGEKPGIIPCDALECALFDENGQFYAASYFGIGEKSISSTYAFFDTDFSKKSPGLHTLLEEIRFAKANKKDYLYLGYCHDVSSHYDYKKNFNGLEYYDWEGNWLDYERVVMKDEK